MNLKLSKLSSAMKTINEYGFIKKPKLLIN